MRWLVGIVLAGCGHPDWVDGCDCREGTVCRYGGGDPFCVDAPAECGSAFDGTCSLDRVDDACIEAICPNIDVDRTHSFDAECWYGRREDRQYRMVDCEAGFATF